VPEAGVPSIADVAHVTLRLGRLMLINGADTAHVQDSVVALADRCGYQAHLLIGAEGLLLTLVDAEGFRTRLGPAISGMTVNMSALGALDRICRFEPASVALIDRQLDEIEKGAHRYGPWLVAIGIGITAAALARLLKDADLRERLGRAAARRVTERHGFNIAVTGLDNILKRVA